MYNFIITSIILSWYMLLKIVSIEIKIFKIQNKIIIIEN